MRKITYPTGHALIKFEKDYYDCLTKSKLIEINDHLRKTTFKRTRLSFETLVKLKFEELIDLSDKLTKHRDACNVYDTKDGITIIRNDFDDLFDYSGNQQKIAKVLMSQKELSLKSCHYCGIDYVNAFNDFPDFTTNLEFINYADSYELQYIDGITEKMANDIITKRNVNKYTKIDELPVDIDIKEVIENLEFSNTHNHFTLDHIIPQKTHAFYSLCLYNLVPCCSPCNTKFKKENPFIIDRDLGMISPTSESYELTNNFQFKILFLNKLDAIKSKDNFVLGKQITMNEAQVQRYLRIFKIPGRYVYHKDLVLRLIQQKLDYPDSKIRELRKQTGLPILELKKMLFGAELFDDEHNGQPLVKLKRDIADNIKIKGIIK